MVEKLLDASRLLRPAYAEIELQRPADNLPDRLPRIHGDVRHLVDHLQRPQLLAAAILESRRQRLAIEDDRAAARRQETRHHTRERRLARSGLPDHGERLPRRHVQRHVVQDLHRGVGSVHVFDLEERSRLIRRRLFQRLADRNEPRRVVLLWRLDDLLHGAVFHGLAVAQHHDVIGDLRDDGEVVRDVERRRAGLFDRALDGGEHVDLRGHVERRRRLIENDQVGFRTERHRGHGPLQLAAGDLMRIAAAECLGRRKPKDAEKLDATAMRLAAGHQAMSHGRLDHLVPDRARRVEGGRGRLRHIGDAVAANVANVGPAELQDIDPVETHFAADDAAAAAPICQCGEANCRLAGAGLADQTEHASLAEREGDAVDDGHVSRGFAGRMDRCFDLEVADIEDRIRHRRGPPSGSTYGSAPSRPPG